jgi:hypothetical protein
MMKLGMGGALLLGAGLLAAPAVAGQQDAATLTTEDVLRTPNSRTNVNAAEAADAAAKAAAAPKPAASEAPASEGYTRVVASSGYTFERPEGWKRVENLESKGAPSFFKYDAVFQDPSTGAVISAVSIDRSQLDSPIDISDTKSVNQLLSTMLNPANLKQGVKIFRQVTGSDPNGTKWLRIKAQGNGQALDGSTVDTMFWVEVAQSATNLALVAVGYPTAKQNDVNVAAFHTVRTLEMENGSGPAAAQAGEHGRQPDGTKAPRKKNGTGGVREQ